MDLEETSAPDPSGRDCRKPVQSPEENKRDTKEEKGLIRLTRTRFTDDGLQVVDRIALAGIGAAPSARGGRSCLTTALENNNSVSAASISSCVYIRCSESASVAGGRFGVAILISLGSGGGLLLEANHDVIVVL